MKLTTALLMVLLLSSCGGNPVIPVSDLTPQESKYTTRVVLDGDTLYNIAWEFGLDYREVALWNRLHPPYQVVPGQKIRLGSATESEPSVGTKTKAIVKALADTEIHAQSLVNEDGNHSMNISKGLPARNSTFNAVEWSWPSSGLVVKKFSEENGNNGIDIAGDEGSPVLAAAVGKVVYAGSGLRGYGLLLILKHDEHFLSAYAHNSLLVVREGDLVEAGQVIAQMGSTGADIVKLHFEIRLDGKPVNPSAYLPVR